MDVKCLCFVGFDAGRPVLVARLGVSKIERQGRGSFLLDTRAPPGASARLSGLPEGYQGKCLNVDEGFAIEIFDNRGRPADHGFALVIEKPGTEELKTHRLSSAEIEEVRRIAAKKEDETKGTKGTSGTEKAREQAQGKKEKG